MITKLKPNEIFVFGSNSEGLHIGGAAKQAYEDFGAVWGVGVGLQGQSYAIPTMFKTTDFIIPYIEQFKQTARLLPEFTFLLTPIGTGIAGFTHEEMKPLFKDMPVNVVLPDEWLEQPNTVIQLLDRHGIKHGLENDEVLIKSFVSELRQTLLEPYYSGDFETYDYNGIAEATIKLIGEE